MLRRRASKDCAKPGMMPHRSNQVVASQDRPLLQPDAPPPPPPPRRRLLVGWATALAALGASTLLLGVGLWLVRYSLAELILGAVLAERGADADFRVVNLDVDRVTLSGVRFGSETSPDAAIPLVEVTWAWRGLSPQLRSLRLVEPRLRLRLDPAGGVSAGSLDRLRGAPTGRRPSAPRIGLEIIDGVAVLDAPFGPVEASLEAAGVIGRDFSARAVIPVTTRPGQDYALDGGQAQLSVVSRDNAMSVHLVAQARGLIWNGARVDGASLNASARAPLDLASYAAEASWQAAAVRAQLLDVRALTGGARFNARAQDDTLQFADWTGRAIAAASMARYGDNTLIGARLDASAGGAAAAGQGRWNLQASRFTGLAMASNAPSASGVFAYDAEAQEQLTARARISLAQTRLDAGAQNDIRAAFPNLDGTPVGPTFARAERALDAAADRFNLVAPITFAADEAGARLRIVEAVDAAAATGARLRVSPLRQDAPGLVLQWPGPTLAGALALELRGGGAPHATLLLDAVTWADGAPFEGDGTLTLADWRADGASIAADELGVSITVPSAGRGRIDLRGPARVTGPLGDGEVRDLVSPLDLAIAWDTGWRVRPNSGCLPVRLGGLDVSSLSFANGAFSLCQLGGALIAADGRGNLSGGFVIRRLGLNGRMAGPNGQPARLSAGSLAGRFSGRAGDITLALEADAPTLSIDMAEARTLAVRMQRMTGVAQLGEAWSVVGAFESGTLSDPSLPGSVSTIAGRWSARSEDRELVLRVEAAEALLTANRPASESERPLFHPLQLVGVDAVLRAGHLTADGAILLQQNAQQLATFSAFHDVDDGVGGAHVDAPSIQFGPALQPYEISERARGLVENVRGPASLVADIGWTRDRIDASGTLGLGGVSLATATIPIVEDVRGDVYFDDLFALTTPPGQTLSVGLVNPGLAARNGRLQFQLLPDQRVAIERAEFDFAQGVLAIAPTTVTVDAPETRLELTLRDVDAADLITTLNIPDLQATGRLEGSFPLVLTRRSAMIENGILRAQPGGGAIAYLGDAGESFTGVARMAFDALRSFRYDDLVLRLDGDLNGEIVSAIEFSGRNTGQPVDLGSIAPVPGVGRVTVRGVPFLFRVRVTAPFRSLAQTAVSIVDPGEILERAGTEEEEEAEDVDQAPAPPR